MDAAAGTTAGGHALDLLVSATSIVVLLTVHSINNLALTVFVGEPATSFIVRELAVRKSSKFFENAMNRDWVESRERKIRLPDDDPEIFAIYQRWVHHSKLCLPSHLDVGEGHPVSTRTYRCSNGAGRANVFLKLKTGYYTNVVIDVFEEQKEREVLRDDRYMCLAKAYILGDKLMDTAFSNAVVDAILAELDAMDPITGQYHYPPNESILEVYTNTPESSPIRRLMLDIWRLHSGERWLRSGSHTWYNDFAEDEEWPDFDDALPKEFLLELAAALFRQIEKNDENEAMELHASNYYGHE